MTPTRNDIEQVIREAITDINLILPTDEKIMLSESTLLFGPGSELDSLNLVNFIVAVEETLETRFGKSISLMTTEGSSGEPSNMSTYESLVEFLTSRVGND